MFNAQGWSKISGGASQIVTLQDGQTIGSPTIWGYKNSADTLADISEADYFDSRAYEVSPGDIIYGIGNDAHNFFVVVGTTTDPAPQVVTAPFSVFGDVDGPGSSVLNAVARYADTTGKSIKNSPVTVADNGDVAGVNFLTLGADGRVEFTNPLGTFKTMWKAGANVADTLYTWPAAFPTINGQVLTGNTDGTTSWTTNGAGDVFGPASSTDNTIPLYSLTSGKLLKTSNISYNGTIFSGPPLFLGGAFQTGAGLSVGFRNPANTFSTRIYGGAITDITDFHLPNGYPSLDDRPLVSSALGIFRFLDGVVLEDVTQATSVTMARNKNYLSTNAVSRSTFTMPLSGFALHDVFRVVGKGVGGWEIAVTGTQTVFAGPFDIVGGQLIQSTLHTDIAYVRCIDATGGAEKFSLVIENGAPTLPSVPAILTSWGATIPINVIHGGSGRTTATTAYGLIAAGTTATDAQQTIDPGTAGQFLVSNGPSALASFQNHTESTVVEVTGTSATIDPGVRYVTNNASLVTLTIPATFPFGQKFEVEGKGAGGWKIQANTGQTVNVGATPTSVAGSVSSTGQYDTVRVDCLTANTTFSVFGGLYAGLNVV